MWELFLPHPVFVSDPSRLNTKQGDGDRSWIFVEGFSKQE